MDTMDWIGRMEINSCGLTRCDAGWGWDTGQTPFQDYDLWTVLKGEGGIHTREGHFPVREGDSCLLRPGGRVVGWQNLENRLTVLHIHFELLDRAGRRVPPDDPRLPPVIRRMEDFGFYQKLLMKALLCYNRADQAGAVRWLWPALLEMAEQDRMPALACGDWKGLIERLCAQIQEYPERTYDLREVARGYGYSPSYFGRIFRRITGLPFTRYCIQARIQMAENLLCITTTPVARIAEKCGYSDVCFFNRQFRERTGRTPAQARREGLRPRRSGVPAAGVPAAGVSAAGASAAGASAADAGEPEKPASE